MYHHFHLFYSWCLTLFLPPPGIIGYRDIALFSLSGIGRVVQVKDGSLNGDEGHISG
jgi:hypothetical protein